jgi:hypothetical protein
MKGCGSCTLCCTLMRVEMAPRPEPAKPEGVKCSHVCRKGCGIYEQRPKACAEFECLWLMSQKRSDPTEQLPKALRPDKSGVVLEVNTHQAVVAHCERPDSWKRGPIGRFLRETATKVPVIIDHGGDDASILESTGTTTPLRYIGSDNVTNERRYVRADLGKVA